MEDVKNIIAENIAFLRQKKKMTQAELGERLNYSDKSVSKWERGETLPSVEVLMALSEIFGVTIDFLTTKNDSDAYDKKYNFKSNTPNKILITLLAVLGIWIIATTFFVYLSLTNVKESWFTFIMAVPLSCIVLLVFNCIWGKKKYLFIIISLILWTTLASVYINLLEYNLWLIFIIGIPLQIAIVLWSNLKIKRK